MSQLVLYYFQGEVGEAHDLPNAFKIPPAEKTTFETFMKLFPVRGSNDFHFRFKEEDALNKYVWRVNIIQLNITLRDYVLK